MTEGDRVLTEHEPERWFSSASMIKTFLAAVAFDSLDLAAPLRVRADHGTGGDGVLGTFESEVELPLLAQQQDRWMLARRVGERVWFAHKTGSIGGVRHDADVLRASGREIGVACFTDGGPHAKWPDHPDCVAMGAAMAATADLLGLDIDAP